MYCSADFVCSTADWLTSCHILSYSSNDTFKAAQDFSQTVLICGEIAAKVSRRRPSFLLSFDTNCLQYILPTVSVWPEFFFGGFKGSPVSISVVHQTSGEEPFLEGY